MSHPPLILRPDAQGFLHGRASSDRVQDAWRAPLNAVLGACRDACGHAFHSFYVRGSVALGQAVAGRSDIDTILLLNDPVEVLDPTWRQALSDRITKAWPQVHSVEVVPVPVSHARGSTALSALLKTQAICLGGANIIPDLTPRRLGFDLVIEGWDLPRGMSIARHLQNTPKAGQATAWIAKRLVRTGMELAMEAAGCYTRDLATCHALFTRHHPEQAAQMDTAFALAIGKAAPRDTFEAMDHFVSGWVYPELCRTYGAEKIARSCAAE